ncbi:MAG TPA: RIP metalloprotease RseP [Gammaproteobacteria bacterium]|nr:RIP metalloprotease RseP [Gammaproteobacteria bacterium]
MFYTTTIFIISILITMLFVVGTHESAHFFAARLLGVKVLRFSIGFGKTLLRWRDKKGTEYVFALIPLGGYVKMLDEGEGPVAKKDLPFTYNRQPFYKKCLIVAAGPAMNIFCALVLYWLIFVIGFVAVKPIIGEVRPHSIAAEAGLKPNQHIVSIDHHPTTTWTTILLRVVAHAGNQDHLAIQVKEPNQSTSTTHLLDLSDWHLDGLSPDPLASLGITPYQPKIPLVIGAISKDSPAAASSLKIGDHLVAINGTPIKDWPQLITFIKSHPHANIQLTVKRQHQPIEITIKLGEQSNGFLFTSTSGYLGIGPTIKLPDNLLQNIQYGPWQAIAPAWQEIVNFTYLNFMLFGKLITGKVSLQSLGGPITIFETAGEALNYGLVPFLGFLAFLSISVGIINVLPIPGLDGGHLCIQFIEQLIGRPIPEKILLTLYRVGFALIFFVLLQALINDILRMLG